MEAIKAHQGKDWLTYKDMLQFEEDKTNLKTQKDLIFNYGWLQYKQIKDLYEFHRRK